MKTRKERISRRLKEIKQNDDKIHVVRSEDGWSVFIEGKEGFYQKDLGKERAIKLAKTINYFMPKYSLSVHKSNGSVDYRIGK